MYKFLALAVVEGGVNGVNGAIITYGLFFVGGNWKSVLESDPVVAVVLECTLAVLNSDLIRHWAWIMQQVDESHTLLQACKCMAKLGCGGSKIQEGYLIFQDFSEKYQMTTLSHTCKTCIICRGEFRPSCTCCCMRISPGYEIGLVFV